MMHPLDVITFATCAGLAYAGLNAALFWLIAGALSSIL